MKVHKVRGRFRLLRQQVIKNEESYENQLRYIKSLEPIYENIVSMYEYVNILLSMDTISEFWTNENEYFKANYINFLHNVEKLYIATAQSVYKESFENDYYGKDYLDRYSHGGLYTEDVLEYLAMECEQESLLVSLSPLNVKITYNDTEDYAQAFMTQYANDELKLSTINSLYITAYEAECDKITVKLLKIRRKIADELGYDSYIDMMYSVYGYTHTPNEMQTFIDNTYSSLASYYTEYISSVNLAQPLQKNYQRLINILYGTYENLGESTFEAYSYMLQHKLYDMSAATGTRLDTSFTSYITSNNSPFIFVNLKNNISDLSTISHQFGKFTYYYYNDTKNYSEGVSEIYAYATELITYATEHRMWTEDALRLRFSTITSIIRDMLKSCALASYELQIYSLSEDEITIERIKEISESVNSRVYNVTNQEISFTKNGHSFISAMTDPLEQQLNSVAAIPAFEIFFAEIESPGSGVALYNQLINSGASTLDSVISSLSLSSPFDEDVINNIKGMLANHTFSASTPDDN